MGPRLLCTCIFGPRAASLSPVLTLSQSRGRRHALGAPSSELARSLRLCTLPKGRALDFPAHREPQSASRPRVPQRWELPRTFIPLYYRSRPRGPCPAAWPCLHTRPQMFSRPAAPDTAPDSCTAGRPARGTRGLPIALGRRASRGLASDKQRTPPRKSIHWSGA